VSLEQASVLEQPAWPLVRWGWVSLEQALKPGLAGLEREPKLAEQRQRGE
jgi:hypothetical protein